MPRKLLLAATFAAFAAAAGTTAIAKDTTGQSGPTATQNADDVAEQGKTKRKKSRARKPGAPPRGSSHGSHSGE